jgi:hypothetical protein
MESIRIANNIDGKKSQFCCFKIAQNQIFTLWIGTSSQIIGGHDGVGVLGASTI